MKKLKNKSNHYKFASLLVTLFVVFISGLGPSQLHAGWGYTCYFYDTVYTAFCSEDPVSGACVGQCGKHEFRSGSTRCGWCHEAWIGYCEADTSPVTVTLDDLVADCVWKNYGNPISGYYTVCDGCANWVVVDTSPGTCYCD